jgi:tetratricopeptide (TPR) repeat protein
VPAGKNDAVALASGGLALAYVAGDPEGGVALINRALTLNPTDLAIEHVARAMRLSPLDPLMFLMQTVTALAHFVAGQYAEAAEWAARANREQPNFLIPIRILVSSNALCGRLDEARNALARACHLDPDFCLSNLKDRVGPLRAEDFGSQPSNPLALPDRELRLVECWPQSRCWPCAPKARITSGGGCHPDSCRLVR